MGWYYNPGQSKQALIEELTHSFERNKVDGEFLGSSVCLDHSVRGNVLWGAWMALDRDGKELDRYITCHLLGKHDGWWGYKPMEEGCHPYYYDCPLKFFKLVPQVACQEWRDKVIEKANEKSRMDQFLKGLIMGYQLKLRDGCKPSWVKVASKKPLMGYGPDGKLYRIRRGLIALPD